MSKKSIGFGKILRKYFNKPTFVKSLLKAGLSLELSRRKMVAFAKNDFTTWMDYFALDGVCRAVNGKKTAWVNMFFPVEIVFAFGLNCVSAEGLSGMFASMFLEDLAIQKAESFGISRNLCTFHRTGIGISMLEILPKPVFVGTTNVLCDGNIPTFTTYSFVNSVPLYVIDVPREDSQENQSYLTKQLEDLVYKLENQLKKKFNYSALQEILRKEKQSLDIIREAYLDLCENPIPMELYQHVNVLYAFHLRPNQLLKAAKTLSKQRESFKDDKIRLLWLHLVPYYDNELYNIFGKNSKFIVVTSEFEWDWFYWNPDPQKPLESLSQKLLKNPEIGDLSKRTNFVTKLASDFKVQGVIHFNHWGCKQSSGSVVLLKEKFEQIGIPFLSLDGDCVDHTNQSAAQYKTRIEAFLEMIK
ncbi:MAG TPA: 2-hydroxyacyl-CoA dehydratase family protein [Pseudothermotoga sp.]